MNLHWKTHILMSVIIMLLWTAGWYLLGQVDGLKKAVVAGQQKYADLQTQAVWVVTQAGSLADETERAINAKLDYKDKLEKQLNLNPDKHALAVYQRKMRHKSRQNYKVDTAMGGP